MQTAIAYMLAFAPLAALAAVGLVCECVAAPLSVEVVFWGYVAGGAWCIALLIIDLIRNN